MRSTILLIIFTCHQAACGSLNNTLYHEVIAYHAETARKAEFASEVVNKIYTAFDQWFFTVMFCEFTYFENRILKYTENNGYPVLLLDGCPDSNTTRTRPRVNKHGQTAYVVTSNELTIEGSDFVTETLKRTGVFKPRSAVIFVINEEMTMNSYFYYLVKNHFQLLWGRSITNSVLILWSERLRIFTYNPFFDEVQDVTNVKDIGHFLTNKYHNLYGHGLRISVFRKIYVSNETGPVLCNSHLQKTVIKFLNATCVPMTPRDGSTVGDLLPNGVATGVTADLIDGYTDLELSSRILKNSYYGYIDTTYPLTQDQLCFLVKNSEKQATFTTTINLISNVLFIIFMIIFIVFITLAIIITKVESRIWNLKDKSSGEIVMDLIKCFIRQTVDIKFLGPVFRFLITIVLIYSLIVDCVIDGVIISALSHSRFRPNINTMSELMNSNLTLGVHNRDFLLFNKSLNPELYLGFKDRIEIFNDQKVKEVIDNREFQYATLIRQSDAIYISRKPDNVHNGRGLFHVVPDCPVPCSIVYGLRYGSPYLPQINFIMDHLSQSGIFGHWSETEQFSLQQSLLSSQKQTRPLDMDNIAEVFYVLLIGLFISTMAFALELSCYHKAYLKFFLKTLVRRFQRLNFCR